MKKFISVLLMLTLVFSCIPFSFADNSVFTIRNGITFNDSIEDVKRKEEFELVDEGSSSLEYTGIIDNHVVSLYYYFSDENRLHSIQYSFWYGVGPVNQLIGEYSPTLSELAKGKSAIPTNYYDSLEEKLIEQFNHNYGQELDKYSPEYNIFVSKFYSLKNSSERLRSISSASNEDTFTEHIWFPQYGDTAVEIELLNYYTDYSPISHPNSRIVALEIEYRFIEENYLSSLEEEFKGDYELQNNLGNAF